MTTAGFIRIGTVDVRQWIESRELIDTAIAAAVWVWVCQFRSSPPCVVLLWPFPRCCLFLSFCFLLSLFAQDQRDRVACGKAEGRGTMRSEGLGHDARRQVSVSLLLNTAESLRYSTSGRDVRSHVHEPNGRGARVGGVLICCSPWSFHH